MVRYQLSAHMHAGLSSGTGEMVEMVYLSILPQSQQNTKTVFTIDQSDTLTSYWFVCALHHRKVSGSIRQQVE